LTHKLGPYVLGTLLSDPVKRLRRGAAEASRRVRGEPHRVQYFHEVDDPYSDLSAQLLAAFAKRYDVELAPMLVGPPPAAAAPERERLVAGVRRSDAPEGRAIRCDRAPGARARSRGGSLTLEFYPSLRSPYTAIAFQRVFDLVERHGVELSMRPVLPMVMRGLPVPAAKRFYIISDTRREADRIGVSFGFICDPVGRPVERGFSLWPFMREKGLGDAYLHAFTRAAFTEGVDLSSDAGLGSVVEGLGVDWADALPHLDGEGWRDELEHNRETLLGLGLWGVPSFRLLGPEGTPEYATWGQDRIWRVEQEITRRLA
jgi:2-hydroxychromene-2-carboxylate isomerase